MPTTFVELGPNNEIIILYQTFVLEIWNWYPPDTNVNAKSKVLNGDTMYLHAQANLRDTDVMLEDGRIESFLILKRFDNTTKLHCLTTLVNSSPLAPSKRSVYRILADLKSLKFFPPEPLSIPNEILDKPCSIKASENFLTVANSDGFMYFFKLSFDKKTNSISFENVNKNFKLNNIKQSCCQPTLAKYDKLASVLEDDQLLLETSTFDGKPIFDLIGSWLVYSPTKYEINHLKNMVCTTNGSVSKPKRPSLSSSTTSTKLFTPIKLPPPGPLLNRVISNLSNNALDGLFKLSELSSKKIKRYMKKDRKKSNELQLDKEVIVSLNSIGKAIGQTLYNTASTIQKTTKNLANVDNEIIKIIDLSNDRTMAIFKPPGGVSSLCLSPYDLQLVNANLRGDNFYMWDLYKSPNEVSLLGKFIRGKTSAIIQEIFWFINNNLQELNGTPMGNNSGFGCITKHSGSIHWYNVNYLSGGNLLNNFPNSLGDKNDKLYNSDNFLDSWILSSLQARKFVALPTCSNIIGDSINGDMNGSSVKDRDRHFFNMNQLAIIDKKNQLKLISPLNGYHGYKYQLPTTNVNYKEAEALSQAYKFSHSEKSILEAINALNLSNRRFEDINPLSQTEIETCGPYLNLIGNKNIEFSTYDFDNDGNDKDNFTKAFTEFGNIIPVKKIDFGNNQFEINKEEDELLNKYSDGLVVDQGEDENDAQPMTI